MEGNPLFGRYEKVVLLLLGFVLTTVGGGLLGNYLQSRSRFKTQQELVFTEVAQMLDSRAHQTQLLVSALRSDTVYYGTVAARRPRYTAMLEEWNMKRNRTAALVRRYFGSEAGRCYRRMNENFVNINFSIRREVEPDSIHADVDDLHVAIHAFDLFLLNRMSSSPFAGVGECDVPLIARRERAPAAAARGTAPGAP